MVGKQTRSGGALQDLNAGSVSGIDLDRPRDAIFQDEIDATKAAQREGFHQYLSELLKMRVGRRSKLRGADIAAVAESAGMKPGHANELAGGAQESHTLIGL